MIPTILVNYRTVIVGCALLSSAIAAGRRGPH
jgi:hypothetical protein